MAATIENLEIQIEANSTNAASGVDALTASLSRLRSCSGGVLGSNNKLSNSFKKIGTSLKGSVAKITGMVLGYNKLIDVCADAFNESNEYIESMNLFRVTMGDAADEALRFAETVEDAMGIDIAEWITNQGVFQRMATGFGIATDQATIMSKNLTQLGYDLASFFNTDVETAMEKLQSGMTGQIKGLKAFGYNLSVAALQETALAHGIEQNVRTMTEAQKAQLRYITLIEHSNGIMGDMARTIITPANAMRILSAQLVQLKRAFGNVVSVIATQVIPWVQAFVEIVTDAAIALANFFGFEMPEIDYSGLSAGVDGLGDSMDDATASAKKMKRQLLGIDELNIFEKNDAGAGVGGLSGGDLGIELPEYDFLDGLSERTDEIKERLKTILALAGLVGLAFLAWRVAPGLISGFTNLSQVLRHFLGFPTVLTKTQAGLASMLPAIAKFAGWAAVIGVIVTRFIDLYKNSEQFRTGVERVGEVISGVFGFAKDILLGVWDILKEVGLSILDLLPVSVKNYILGALGEIKAWVDLLDLDWKDLLITIAGLGLLFVPGGQIMGIVLLAFEGMTVALRAFGLMSDETWAKMKETVSNVASAIKDFFLENMRGVIQFFTGVFTGDWRKCWDGLKTIGTATLDLLNKLWSRFGDSIKTAFRNAVNGAIAILNRFIDWCNKKLRIEIPAITILGQKITDRKTIQLFTIPKIPTFAEGGFPNMGEMFIAREAGPELVGRIGNKSAVANNDQIADALAVGVRDANEPVVTAIYAMAQRIITTIEENSGDVYLDARKVSDETTKTQNRRNRMYNKSLSNA